MLRGQASQGIITPSFKPEKKNEKRKGVVTCFIQSCAASSTLSSSQNPALHFQSCKERRRTEKIRSRRVSKALPKSSAHSLRQQTSGEQKPSCASPHMPSYASDAVYCALSGLRSPRSLQCNVDCAETIWTSFSLPHLYSKFSSNL